MTSVTPAGDIRVSILVDEDKAVLLELLEKNKLETVYLRSLVHEFGVSPNDALGHGRFYGSWRNRKLQAVVFVGNARNMTTLGHRNDFVPLLTRVSQGPYRPRLFVGPEEHAPDVRRLMFEEGTGPRLDRQQTYCILTQDTLTRSEPLELRQATPSELDRVVESHAAMIEEDLTIPYAHLDLGRLRRLAKKRIQEGKIWIHTQGDELVFKTEEIARSADAVLVGGVFTASKFRGQGYAGRGMATWAEHIFESGVSTLALHVNSKNTPAMGAYQRAGFRNLSTLRLILTY